MEKLFKITDTQINTSADLLRHSDIFLARIKAAEGLKTKDSKLPDFMRRLATVVPTICTSVPFLLYVDMTQSALKT